ncbi:hypothetical protein CBER1_10266 [Cercospora berteroae]|uniref:Uncharacterized protein n=1 Tax=Cercospora berteroae TaxID=357750 RepID=A0A2S6BXU1_9PEZI|nr:hypothetical protein CBER1_10266 [Cercospora berteroae]
MSRETTPEEAYPQLLQWPIAKVVKKRYTDQGVIELKAEWQPTTVRFSQVSTDEDNTIWVDIDGERTKGVKRRVRVGVHEESGEELWSIEWKSTWRSVWGLAGAMDAVSEYHESHLDDVRRKEGKWWRISDLGPLVQPAEGEPAPGTLLDLIDGRYLVPEQGRDYTLAISANFFGSLNGMASKASVRYLNMPVRQRLIFTDTYIESLETSRKKGINLRSHLRLLLVYVTGLARSVDMCTRCEAGYGPLLKCVIDDTAAAGTCVNCAISISETSSCQWWHHNRRGDRPSLWNPALLETDPGANGGVGPIADEGAGTSAGGEAMEQAQGVDGANNTRADSAGLFVTPGMEDRPGPAQPDGDPGQTGGATPVVHSSSTLGRNDASTAFVTPASARSQGERVEDDPQNSVTKTKLESPSAEPRKQSSEPTPGPSKRRRHDARTKSPSWIGKHRNCTSARFGRPCRDPIVGAWQTSPDEPVRVGRDCVFAYGEASDRDVNDVLRCCPCDQAEAFEEMYQLYLESQLPAMSDESLLSKAECIAKVWYEELNQAVRLYCPAPGQPSPDAPECIELD